MPDFDSRAYALTQVTDAGNFYRKDLDALSDEAILGSPGGEARSPIDFTYEVAMINRRIAARLRGEDVPPMPEIEGWMVAPPEWRAGGKAKTVAEFDASMKDVIDAIGDDVSRPLVTPARTTTAFEVALFCGLHVMYHDAQLNYVQALNGDSAMHWD